MQTDAMQKNYGIVAAIQLQGKAEQVQTDSKADRLFCTSTSTSHASSMQVRSIFLWLHARNGQHCKFVGNRLVNGGFLSAHVSFLSVLPNRPIWT